LILLDWCRSQAKVDEAARELEANYQVGGWALGRPASGGLGLARWSCQPRHAAATDVSGGRGADNRRVGEGALFAISPHLRPPPPSSTCSSLLLVSSSSLRGHRLPNGGPHPPTPPHSCMKKLNTWRTENTTADPPVQGLLGQDPRTTGDATGRAAAGAAARDASAAGVCSVAAFSLPLNGCW
jgi:hypothetical protein